MKSFEEIAKKITDDLVLYEEINNSTYQLLRRHIVEALRTVRAEALEEAEAKANKCWQETDAEYGQRCCGKYIAQAIRSLREGS